MSALAISQSAVKRKTIWPTPKTFFNDSLGRLFNNPDECLGYDLQREPRRGRLEE